MVVTAAERSSAIKESGFRWKCGRSWRTGIIRNAGNVILLKKPATAKNPRSAVAVRLERFYSKLLAVRNWVEAGGAYLVLQNAPNQNQAPDERKCLQ